MFEWLKLQVVRVFSLVVYYLVEWESKDPLTEIIPVLNNRKCIQDIANNFTQIKDEIMKEVNNTTTIEGDLFFGSEITNDGKWKKKYVKWYSELSQTTKETFPVLCQVLERNNDVRLAMISKLEPGAIIKPHNGVYRGCIRVHVGISTPNDKNCYLKIGNCYYWWKDGEVIGFDDTYLHFVENKTNQERIILFLDIDREMKNKWSQTFVKLISSYIGKLTFRD